jgi:hypothetical protein
MHTYRPVRLAPEQVRYVVGFDTGQRGEEHWTHIAAFRSEALAIRLVSVLNGGGAATETLIRLILNERSD